MNIFEQHNNDAYNLQLLQSNQMMMDVNYRDIVKNRLKLKIYGYNISTTMKYYERDSFCVLGALNDCGKKAHKQRHSNENEFNVSSLIAKQQYDQALNMLNYLAYHFQSVIYANDTRIYDLKTIHNRLILIYEMYFLIMDKHNYGKQMNLNITLDKKYIDSNIISRNNSYLIAGCSLYLRKRNIKSDNNLIEYLYTYLCNHDEFKLSMWCHQHTARFLISINKFNDAWREYEIGLNIMLNNHNYQFQRNMYQNNNQYSWNYDQSDIKCYKEDMGERFFKRKEYNYALSIFKTVTKGERSPKRVAKIEKILKKKNHNNNNNGNNNNNNSNSNYKYNYNYNDGMNHNNYDNRRRYNNNFQKNINGTHGFNNTNNYDTNNNYKNYKNGNNHYDFNRRNNGNGSYHQFGRGYGSRGGYGDSGTYYNCQ